MCVQLKQREVAELLARADDLAAQNRSYQEVYGAMAQSLSEAWLDLNKQLDYRKLLLDQSINFHDSAVQVTARGTDYHVLFFSRPRSEGRPHHGRTFSIYPCPL